MTTTNWIACWGNGSWGGEGKVHAADPASGAKPLSGPVSYKSETRYTSRCGQRFMRADNPPRPFGEFMAQQRCQRCEKLVAADG